MNVLATTGGIEERGAIYTKREVVDFILDLVGYTTEYPLTGFRLLEPSFGQGDFLLPALDRLLAVASQTPGGMTLDTLGPAIRGVELHQTTFEATRHAVVANLDRHGMCQKDREKLVNTWFSQGDFLLEDFNHRFTHVVGNPPYVRQECIPDILMAEYRRRYLTIYDRADIYVPFIEHSLRLLDKDGKLGIICADRWMKNKYGRKLREFVSRHYRLRTYVDMVGTDAFRTEVSAYPAITVFERGKDQSTRVFARPTIDANFLEKLATELRDPDISGKSRVRQISGVAIGSAPWVLDSFDELALVRRLEREFPSLEDAGCKVGIGVATGADKAFIGDYDTLDVEICRKLPLVMTRDILDGHVSWRGKGIVNPFGEDGKLVDLDDYPKLKAYFDARRDQIICRHVAKKNPNNWYRTIDRISPALTYQEKLLIPDIKGNASVVYENGSLYPHHNLYFITSSEWEIMALKAVLCSGIARLFVALYCTKMRGGYLRFQAQYLRKIRLPRWQDVSPNLRASLAGVSKVDTQTRNEIISEIYRLSPAELKLIEGIPLNES